MSYRVSDNTEFSRPGLHSGWSLVYVWCISGVCLCGALRICGRGLVYMWVETGVFVGGVLCVFVRSSNVSVGTVREEFVYV